VLGLAGAARPSRPQDQVGDARAADRRALARVVDLDLLERDVVQDLAFELDAKVDEDAGGAILTTRCEPRMRGACLNMRTMLARGAVCGLPP
jgi:hypothetical protein